MSVPIESPYICDFLYATSFIVINTNWQPISYRFEVRPIADYSLSLEHCVFESPVGGLGTKYVLFILDSLESSELVVNFLFVLTWD